jgi:hypothetical protein
VSGPRIRLGQTVGRRFELLAGGAEVAFEVVDRKDAGAFRAALSGGSATGERGSARGGGPAGQRTGRAATTRRA